MASNAGSAAQTVATWLAWQYLKCIYTAHKFYGNCKRGRRANSMRLKLWQPGIGLGSHCSTQSYRSQCTLNQQINVKLSRGINSVRRAFQTANGKAQCMQNFENFHFGTETCNINWNEIEKSTLQQIVKNKRKQWIVQ